MQNNDPMRGAASSLPGIPRAVGDLGPGRLQGGGVGLSPSQLLNAVQNSPDPSVQLAAESIRTQVPANCNFNGYPFSIAPPASLLGVQPATVVVVIQQILGSNPARKSLFYQETQNAGRQASGVTQSGILLQPGPSATQVSNGAAANAILAGIIQTSFLSAGGNVAIDAPAPTNAITVVAQWGPPAVAGTAIVPLSGVIFEGS